MVTRWVGCIFFVVIIGIGGIGFAAAEEQPETTVEGAIIPLDDEEAAEVLEEVDDAAGPAVDPPDSVGLLDTGDGSYVVVIDEEVPTAQVKVSGQLVPLSGVRDAIIADSFDELSTDGVQTQLSEFQESPREYNGQLIQVEVNPYSQGAFNGDVASGAAVKRAFVGAEMELSTTPTAPGSFTVEKVQNAVRGLSNDGQRHPVNMPYHIRQGMGIRGGADDPVFIGLDQGAFWAEQPATVDVAVVERRAYVAGVSFHDVTKLDGLGHINRQSIGDVVEVQGNVIGSSVSTKETLTQTLPCGTDAFYIGPTCVPAVLDAVIHTGVIYETNGEMVPYAGVSNAIQTTSIDPDRGTANIVGEVVDPSAIDPAFNDGRALLVYKMEMVEVGGGQAPAEVQRLRFNLEESIEEQVIGAADEDQQQAEGGDSESSVEIIDVGFVEQHVPGGPVEVYVEFENTADKPVNYDFTIERGGEVYKTESVAVPSQDTIEYEVEIDGEIGQRAQVSVEGERVGVADFTEREDDSSTGKDSRADGEGDNSGAGIDDNGGAGAAVQDMVFTIAGLPGVLFLPVVLGLVASLIIIGRWTFTQSGKRD